MCLFGQDSKRTVDSRPTTRFQGGGCVNRDAPRIGFRLGGVAMLMNSRTTVVLMGPTGAHKTLTLQSKTTR